MCEPENDDERTLCKSLEAVFMDCMPGNYDHADGESAVILTMEVAGMITPFVISMADGRRLAARLLVCLATNDDAFAEELLENNFPIDQEGYFHWPKQS